MTRAELNQARYGEIAVAVCLKLIKPNCIRFTQYGPVTHRPYIVTSGQTILVDERDAPQLLGQVDKGQHLYEMSDECDPVESVPDEGVTDKADGSEVDPSQDTPKPKRRRRKSDNETEDS